MSGQLRKPDMPEDEKGEPLYLRRIEAALAKTKGTIATGAATDITLDTDAKFLSITVEDYGIYMRAQATASATNYDLYLLPGQHDLAIGDGVTAISMIARAGAAYAVVIEKSRI